MKFLNENSYNPYLENEEGAFQNFSEVKQQLKTKKEEKQQERKLFGEFKRNKSEMNAEQKFKSMESDCSETSAIHVSEGKRTLRSSSPGNKNKKSNEEGSDYESKTRLKQSKKSRKALR